MMMVLIMMNSMMMMLILMMVKMVHVQWKIDGYILSEGETRDNHRPPHPTFVLIIICMMVTISQWSC